MPIEQSEAKYTQRVFDKLLRQRLDFFIGRVFQHLKPNDDFSFNWLVQAMAYQLTAVQQEKLRRLIINVPPRHLKSVCTSVAFPAFLLGNDPTTTIILTCYSGELGEKMMRDLRSVMTSDWYRRAFPRTNLKKNAAAEITTTVSGGVNMTSVHGTLTGRGAKIIIVDDPIKAQDVNSDAERKKVNEWFQNTLFSRLDNKRTGAIVVSMQRLHEEDVTGYLTEDPNHRWTEMKVPAIGIETVTYPILKHKQRTEYVREAGSVIDSDRESHETLETIKTELGSLAFSAQYQQEPISRDGNLVKREWFKFYSAQDQPPRFDSIIVSWDTASAAGDNNDFSVGTVWGSLDGKHFLLDLVRVRLEYPSLKRKIVEVGKKWNTNLILLEKADSGRNLYSDLKNSDHQYQAKTPRGSKEDRLAACSSLIENGSVILPSNASWLKELLNELVGFPNTKHDDQVDSVSQFLNFMRSRRTLLKYDHNDRLIRARRQRISIRR